MLAKGRNTDSVKVETGIVLCWPKGATQAVCKLKLELCYVGQRAQHRQCVKLKLELCYVGQRAQHR